jgi:hypothetical protein
MANYWPGLVPGDDRQPLAVGVAWAPDGEPDRQHPEALCGVVSSFKDVMPSPVVDSLLRLPYNVGDSVGVDRRERDSQGVEKSHIFAWTRSPRVMEALR